MSDAKHRKARHSWQSTARRVVAALGVGSLALAVANPTAGLIIFALGWIGLELVERRLRGAAATVDRILSEEVPR